MKRAILLGFLFICALSGQGVEIHVGGSTALAPLVEQATVRYAAQHPKVTIKVQRMGSKAAMEALAQGRLEIALSDVEARPVEHGESYKVSHLILQAFVFVAHPGVPAAGLSVDQARDFFLKKGAQWPGTESLPVVPIVRGAESGTAAVQRHLTIGGGQDFGAHCQTRASTDDVLRTVSSTPGAVGFVELSNAMRFGTRVKVLTYDGVSCLARTVKDGSYPLLDLGRAYHRPSTLPPRVLKEVEGLIALIRDPDFQLESAFGNGGFPVQWYRDLRAEGLAPAR